MSLLLKRALSFPSYIISDVSQNICIIWVDHSDSSHVLNCNLLPCWPWASLHLDLVWCHCGISLSVHQRGGHVALCRELCRSCSSPAGLISVSTTKQVLSYTEELTIHPVRQHNLWPHSVQAAFPPALQTSNETIKSCEILILLPQPDKDSHFYTFLHCSGPVQIYFSLALNCNIYTFLKRKFYAGKEDVVSVSLLS